MQCRFLVCLVFFLASTSSAQEDLLACVDPDVREGLLVAGAGPGARVSRAVPEPLIGLPDSDVLEYIGSSVTDFQTVAAYKTDLVPGEAIDAATGILEDSGWQGLETGGPPRGGFVTREQPLNQTLCRDSEFLNLMGRATDDTTYVSMHIMAPTGFACESGVGGPFRGFAPASRVPNVYEYMPTLTLPDGAQTIEPMAALIASFTGSPGNSRTAATSIDVETELSTPELAGHFEQQLRDQGWTLDSRWSGEFSSGSGWTATPEDEANLVGLLDLVPISESGYQATFRASVLDNE